MLDGGDPTLDGPRPGEPADIDGSGGHGAASSDTTAPRIGAYTVLRLLGKGGMGAVYEAEQKHPRRLVALKVIRASFATPSLLKRFEHESHVLGCLKHPGIAQIYQAGSLKDRHGRTTPYFAMELVAGETLTRHAETHGLDMRQRLALLARVCDAVNHAHQKGVIHRDLKPANVLVDRDGQPKILDFGVARATDGDVQQVTMQTEVGQIVGTVQYMSPEPASGRPDEVDTRSDVYALGMIAYELLTGQLPYDVRRKMIHEAVRIVREEEPTRLSAIDRNLRGDVETIVAKAMEKEKERRYQSAEALAGDIRRYLDDEPIAARPAGAWYQMRKFARRHKGLTAGAAAALLALVAGVVSTGLALGRALAAETHLTTELERTEAARVAEAAERQRADDERRRADEARTRAASAEAEASRRADELEQVADFQAAMLRRVNPAAAGRQLGIEVKRKFVDGLDRAAVARGGGARVGQRQAFEEQWGTINTTDLARDFLDRTMLKPAVKLLDRRFKDQPAVDARLRQILADRYRDLGLYDAAMPLQERALALRRETLGMDHPLTRISTRAMGDLLTAQGRLTEAAPFYREVLQHRPPRPRSAMARLLEVEGKPDEAEPQLRELLAKSRAGKGDERVATLRVMDRLAGLLERQGRLDEAEPLRREAVETGRNTLGERHPDLAVLIGALGALLFDRNALDEAEPLLREALEKDRSLHGETHPSTLVDTIRMASLLEARGRAAEVVDLLAPAEAAARAAFTGANAGTLASLLLMLGGAQVAMGEFAGAEERLLGAYAILAKREGAEDARRECARSLVDLYVAWHVAAPNGEHDSDAAKWAAMATAEPDE